MELCHLDNGFKIDSKCLTQLMKEKNLHLLQDLEGIDGVVSALQTNNERGIDDDGDNIARRLEAFGSNTYKKPPSKSLFHFMWQAAKDLTIVILLGCAALSLGFGIKQHGLKEGWYDGGSIFVAVFLIVVVSAFSDYRQSKQFRKLSKASEDIPIDVVRGGRRRQISNLDIVVGDVVFLKIGDQVPADGLFLRGHSLRVDESSMTGESEHVEVNGSLNPFLFSGTKVVDGYGEFLVASVGMNSTWGEMMSLIGRDTSDQQTPLQARLSKLTPLMAKIGLGVAFLVFVVLVARYFTGNTKNKSEFGKFEGNKTKIDDVVNAAVDMVAVAVIIVVIAIPEGFPLAVTLTLAYSMKKMMADQALVRRLSACETMGCATVICTDKTGTLTLNEMKVTKFWLGQESVEDDAGYSSISDCLLDLIREGVAFNTTGSVYRPSSGSGFEFSGSPTEKAILSWATLKLHMDMEKLKKQCVIQHVEVFNSHKKRSGVLMRRKDDNTTHVHWKGAAEMILEICSSYYDASGVTKDLNDDERLKFEEIIQGMAASSLRCIAFAHKQVQNKHINDEKYEKLEESSLILLGLVGLKDPCRPGVREAVEACQLAGVQVKMITGDNVFTAKAIASECGILRPHQEAKEAVVEGIEFRNFTPEQRMQKVDGIHVMARSSPFDKLLMVQCLKQKGNVVAVTGDGTNDAPALKEADIGLSMGIQGTEVAKESSDIVILDDNFATLVTVLRWGRGVYANIQKFVQFQLTINVATLVVNFVAAASAGEVPLTAVQLLWVNLIMDTMAALALATDKPTKELMEKPPVGQTDPVITNIMWRNLLPQALFQIVVLLVLQFKGRSIFGVSDKVNNTLIFNVFVFCQVFNELNSRDMERINIFKGSQGNRLFWGILVVTIAVQVVMVELLNKFADTERLSWGQWGACIGIAAISWPISWVFKFIPVPAKPIFSYLKRDSKRELEQLAEAKSP
ncbi:putative calcium-transporting ATPase 13, plasma membrane-type [Pyrus x bretschneideri]|uniref:putative calcium-transporting ATPase 13, plasma membrane-type n=1 Tax=Pyrus x bretschneideri TaxID=225117 RepID=UPI00202FD798|nr:putative calcium-transporting ATPase 13, plasma membrane-type [Pyrus x bretschneideri]